MDSLVSTAWLAGEIGAPDLVVLDASYHPLDPARDPAAEFAAGHIPGARFLDLATLADLNDALPSMAPSPQAFARRIGALGVGDGSRVVLYDDAPHHTAARAWWLFRLFGVGPVALLDGGLAVWKAQGRAVETGPSVASGTAPPAVRHDRSQVRSLAEMREIHSRGTVQILDARSPARFSGEDADPRPGVAPGHIPGAKNLRYDRLFAPGGAWKSSQEIGHEFAAARIALDAPVVTTCGSGITAAVLAFGAHLAGKDDVALYDGSWSEWGADPETPKAIGPA